MPEERDPRVDQTHYRVVVNGQVRCSCGWIPLWLNPRVWEEHLADVAAEDE